MSSQPMPVTSCSALVVLRDYTLHECIQNTTHATRAHTESEWYLGLFAKREDDECCACKKTDTQW
jgi:hypothetical protein